MSLAKLQSAARQIARTFHVGSTSWTVTAPPVGLGGAATSVGTVTGYATQGRFGQQGYAAPGTPVEPLKWYWTAAGADTLAARQRITDGTYTFTVVGVAAEGLGVYELERS